jgi:ribonuclease HI
VTLFLFSDGAARKSGLGGWACVAVSNGQEVWRISGGAVGTTNNRMELMGIMQGLAKAFQRGATSVNVFTDSQYAIRVLTRSHQRLTAANGDLIKQCSGVLACYRERPRFHWIKGHNGHEWNELADKLATAARDGKTLA